LSELQHPDSRSFEQVAALYERVRPEYPPDAIAWIVGELDLRPGRTVLDLAAGTGKLTRQLVASGADVVAVEPGEAMLAELRRAVPTVTALHGGAEEIPVADDSVDALTVGQAFHWFRFEEATEEMHRVLRPGGRVALLWNNRDQEDALQREVTELMAPFVPPGRAAAYDSSKFLAQSPLFDPLDERTFQFAQRLDTESLVGRIMSISFVAAAEPAKRLDLEGRLRELAESRGGRVDFPYVTSVYVSRAM
jgi:ubiquinone/menaquinone biosynthesis C-methylase UbiE